MFIAQERSTCSVPTTTEICTGLVKSLHLSRVITPPPFVFTRKNVCTWTTRRTMVADSPSVFRTFLQEFFVKASDPLFTCTLKLDVLTALVTKDNCATILGELQTYVLHRDKSFVCAAVRAVGRVADARPEAADQCLHVRDVVVIWTTFENGYSWCSSGV